MASTWAAKLPRVKVALGREQKTVTFVIPYYESPQFLLEQIGVWAQYPAGLRPFLRAIVVDDGSPSPAWVPPIQPFPIRLFRIGVDVPWNWLAARNIGAHHADEGWLLLTDMDHVVPNETVQSLVCGAHDPGVVYVFSRREHTGQEVPPHSASFLMTRKMFWSIGGYDETLSGHYGTDGEFRRRVAAKAPMQVLTDVLIRHEYVSDASTSRYRRKLPEDAAAVQQMVHARTSDWTPKTLSFEYQEVTC